MLYNTFLTRAGERNRIWLLAMPYTRTVYAQRQISVWLLLGQTRASRYILAEKQPKIKHFIFPPLSSRHLVTAD